MKYNSRYYTYWQIKERPYPLKRYVLIFDKYRGVGEGKYVTINEYDTLEEVKEEKELINEFYKNTPKPKQIKNRSFGFEYDYSGGAYFWGYIILDIKANKIIDVGNDGINVERGYYHYRIKSKNLNSNLKDFFFRKDNEIPENYKWDGDWEFNGWLQFRWGDKKNAINYVDNKNKKINKDLEEEDYSLQPCSLSEEIAEDEYIDNGGTFNPESALSSIADMLGKDNPLLKIKEQLEND